MKFDLYLLGVINITQSIPPGLTLVSPTFNVLNNVRKASEKCVSSNDCILQKKLWCATYSEKNYPYMYYIFIDKFLIYTSFK